MRAVSRLVLAGGATLIMSAVGLVAASQPAPAGNATNGKRLFERDGCYQCHGYAGQGGRDGARLAATSMTVPAFVRYLRRPFGAMPAYTDKVLSDAEASDVFAYLKSLPSAKAAKDIPLLSHLHDK
jgi:mono/diheme cytochrome c family protein